MPRYLISFDDGSMDHIPDEDWPEVAERSHAVVQEAKDAGVWIFGGGVERQQATIVGTEGDHGRPGSGDEGSHRRVFDPRGALEGEALEWAARIGCRCAQEVRQIMYDPAS